MASIRMSFKCLPVVAFGGALLASLCTARSAGATLLAEEQFAYQAGQSINGLTGGTGWQGGWVTGQANAFVGDPAINGAPAIGEAGGATLVEGSGRVFRRTATR